MELTFEQQVIVAVIGGVVASILTSILNNWWTDRRLRDQWEREKEERREQWRREDEARKGEWKRQYREELLRPFLEKVDRIVALIGLLAVAGSRLKHLTLENPQELTDELNKEIWSATPLGIGDKAFHELTKEFHNTTYYLRQASIEDLEAEKLEEQHMQLQGIAGRLHKRAEELLELTFD